MRSCFVFSVLRTLSLFLVSAALSPLLQAQRSTASASSPAISSSIPAAQNSSPGESMSASPAASKQQKIQRQLNELHRREQAQATSHELAFRWARIGAEYANSGDVVQAENAYSHALKQLEGQSSEATLYADVLDQMGALYRIYGRFDDAMRCYRASLTVREPLQDPLETARSRARLAELALLAHHYKEAYTETDQAYRSMSNMHDPDDSDRISALIVRAYARCGMHQCRQAHQDAEDALALSNREFPGNTMQVGASLVALGFLQLKNGESAPAEESLRRAVTLMKAQLAATDPRLTFAMGQYRESLLALHRKEEARSVQDELAAIARQPNCAQCSVSAFTFRTPASPSGVHGPRSTCEEELSTPAAAAPQAP